ncbi:hypothetical protein [Streptomyces sp. NRRL F-5755]|uniref:hypothetical protein n=1 Tax=Streptomyces sp. NRRL F-5755 TaxID=1519475 RepID=UPI001331247E
MQVLAGAPEALSVPFGEARLDRGGFVRGGLDPAHALPDDRPHGGFVRRVEAHRPEPRILRHEPGDHGIADGEPGEAAPVDVERENAGQLIPDDQLG